MNSDEILRRNVTKLREERGWSIQDLASRLGIDRTYLSKSESGNRAFKVSEIDKLAKIFDVSTDYLLGRKSAQKQTIDLAKDPEVLLYKGRKVSAEDMEVIKAILERHED